MEKEVLDVEKSKEKMRKLLKDPEKADEFINLLTEHRRKRFKDFEESLQRDPVLFDDFTKDPIETLARAGLICENDEVIIKYPGAVAPRIAMKTMKFPVPVKIKVKCQICWRKIYPYPCHYTIEIQWPAMEQD
ncbi:MAG: hypothetical protein ACE5K4_05120 [Candidatus Hydrothermarchaeota archaeon]